MIGLLGSYQAILKKRGDRGGKKTNSMEKRCRQSSTFTLSQGAKEQTSCPWKLSIFHRTKGSEREKRKKSPKTSGGKIRGEELEWLFVEKIQASGHSEPYEEEVAHEKLEKRCFR